MRRGTNAPLTKRRILFGVMFVLLAVGCSRPPDVEVSARDLLAAFHRDASGATARYIGKRLRVAGTIVKVERLPPPPYVYLEGGSPEAGQVVCSFPSVFIPGRAAVGSSVHVEGTCTYWFADDNVVTLEKCSIGP